MVNVHLAFRLVETVSKYACTVHTFLGMSGTSTRKAMMCCQTKYVQQLSALCTAYSMAAAAWYRQMCRLCQGLNLQVLEG